jgi:GAF domain-containing protein
VSWQRRNQADQALQALLGETEQLELWRLGRRQVCEIAAEKAKGGSVHPIGWLSFENALNRELLRQIRRPLLQNADL